MPCSQSSWALAHVTLGDNISIGLYCEVPPGDDRQSSQGSPEEAHWLPLEPEACFYSLPTAAVDISIEPGGSGGRHKQLSLATFHS